MLGACSLAVSACGGGGSGEHRAPTGAAGKLAQRASVPARPGPLRARAAGVLPAPVQSPAAAMLPGGPLLVIGGLDSTDVSVATVLAVRGSNSSALGELPQPVHDAAGAALGRRAYVFGGGTGEVGTDTIVAVDATGQVTPAGRLPAPASDASAAVVGQTAYVVGGYTGTTPLRSIVAFRPGAAPRVAGRLPLPLRYPAVAAVNGRVLIAGGTSGVTPQRAILSFDPASGRVTRLAELSHSLTHAAGASLNGTFYVIGGRSTSPTSQTGTILGVDPRTGRSYGAGRLPNPLSDATAVTDGPRILVVGGRDAAGVRGEVLELEPAA